MYIYCTKNEIFSYFFHTSYTCTNMSSLKTKLSDENSCRQQILEVETKLWPPVSSAKPADASLETSWRRVWKYGTTVKHQDALSPHDTLLFISSLPPISLPPSRSTGALLGSLAEAAPSREAAECRGPGPRQEPKLVSASQHVELACLGHSQMVLQLPLCPPSLSKQRTETN